MQEAVPVGKGAMLAVLGSNVEEINIYIVQLKDKGVCEIANDNAVGQIIVSGNIETIEELKNNLKAKKKKKYYTSCQRTFSLFVNESCCS